MIAFGVCVSSRERFESSALAGIIASSASDDALLTATETGLAEGYNEILDAAVQMDGLEAVVLLAEDVEIVDPQFAEKLRASLVRGVDVLGVVGASGGNGLGWWTWTKRYGGVRTLHGPVMYQPGPADVDVIDGLCMILSPQVVAALRFDVTNYPKASGLDLDFCFQARERGLRVAVDDLALLQHGAASTERGPESVAADAAFQAKWARAIATRVEEDVAHQAPPSSAGLGATSDRFGATAAGTKSGGSAPANYYGFDRPELVALVPKTARRVLDVGCEAGAVGAAVKRRLPLCQVSGVEIVESAVERAAERLDFAARADLNEPIDLPFPAGYFDVMICGDVLEHLLDPEESLRRLLPYLATDGVLISSIPNIKHWSVMIPALAQDRWEYTDAGLLDRTHVQLFTLHEAKVMLENVGLGQLAHLGANVIPLEPVERLDPLVAAAVAYGADAASVREALSCYQYLIVSRRPKGRQFLTANSAAGLL